MVIVGTRETRFRAVGIVADGGRLRGTTEAVTRAGSGVGPAHSTEEAAEGDEAGGGKEQA